MWRRITLQSTGSIKEMNFIKIAPYDLALRCYDKAIEINPQYADAWHNKGDILKESGRTTEADAAFAKATDLGYEDSKKVEIKPDKIAGETTVIDNSTVLLFDASDSMSGDKMSNAKIAIKEFISGLDPASNEVALIVFYDCGSIKVEQPFTTDQSIISSKVDRILPSRNTPISAAIDLAQNYIAKNANGTTKKIILFTDGEETCPYTATYKGPDDIEISIIGFDIRKGSTQETKLQDIAKKVGGNYLNADDASTPVVQRDLPFAGAREDGQGQDGGRHRQHGRPAEERPGAQAGVDLSADQVRHDRRGAERGDLVEALAGWPGAAAAGAPPW